MINTCKRCSSENLEFKEKYELTDPETEEVGYYDGVLCLECGCFHSIDDEFFQYDVGELNLSRNCFK